MPNANYAHNATGGAISITRGAPGNYTVKFGNPVWWIGEYGFAVTAYGSSRAVCQMRNHMTVGNTLTAYVFCFDRVTHALVDSRFTLLVVNSGSLNGRYAFAWADETMAPSYTPDPAFSYTSGPGSMLITHGPGNGDYTVNLGTGTTKHATVLVNATYGFQDVCKVGQWHSTTVQVLCFDSTGAPVNEYYWVLQLGTGGRGGRLGFAFADKSTTPSYTPNLQYSYNSSGGAVTAMRTSTGTYMIDFEGLQKLPGHKENVQVTPWGNGTTTCKVVSWGNTATALRVNVECRKLNGNLGDARYNVLVIE